MSELTFAKQFLTALDSRPIKLSSDHVADPRNYPAQSAYILPKLSNAKRKRSALSSDAPSSTATAGPTATVTLKSVRSPGSPVILSQQGLSTSVYDIKTAYASKSGAGIEKIKLLYSKKPVADSKTLKEILGDGAAQDGSASVEFSVMVMGGGAPSPAPAPTPPIVAPEPMDVDPKVAKPVAAGPSGTEVLRTEEFWADLKSFLMQRLKDEEEGEKLASLFKNAWEKGS